MKKQITILSVLLLLVAIFIWPSGKPSQTTPHAKKNSSLQVAPNLASSQSLDNKFAIQRLAPVAVIDHKQKATDEAIEDQGYGTFPPVDLKKTNVHKEYLLKALQKPEKNSGAISIIGKREKFNSQRYQKKSAYYLDTIEPGRCFEAAQAAPNVAKLGRIGFTSIQATQNKTVTLQAQTQESQPVSFTAFDGGHFQNGLSSITLKADISGIATAEYTPTAGVINQSRIQAASPVNSGTLKWTVFVRLDKQLITNKEEGQ